MSTARATRFAHKYVQNGFRGPQAVIDLGFTDNRASAWVISHRLLRNVTVQQTIERHRMDAKLSADETLANLSRIARTEVEFKGSDVLKANEIMAKHHKLITDKVEMDATVTDLSDDQRRARIAELFRKAEQIDDIAEQNGQIN